VATYRVQIPKVLWFSITVEADDEEAAITEAFEEAPGLCAQCSGWGRNWSIDEDDWGGIADALPQFEVKAELIEDGGE
jgi:hypothetical protein